VRGLDDESARPRSNGVAQLAPDQILEKAKAAAKAASSVHLNGTITAPAGDLAVDLRYNLDAGTVGTVTVNRAPFQLVYGQDLFLKASAQAWTRFVGDSRAGELLSNRWVRIPPKSAVFENVATVATFDRLIDLALSPVGALTKTGSRTVRGVSVIGVVDEANDETLYVAAEGEPYPVQAQGHAWRGAVDFLDWNKPVDVQAPPPDQVVDLSEVTGQ
jgi:hypothetical protein